MRVLICGSRGWGVVQDGAPPEREAEARSERNAIESVLCGLYEFDSCGWLTVIALPFIVISGMAAGADSVAKDWIENCPLHGEVVDLKTYDSLTFESRHGMPVALDPYPADWVKHRKAAGPIRNKQMLDEGKPDVVWAFKTHDDSRGTNNMISQARKAGVPVYVVTTQ